MSDLQTYIESLNPRRYWTFDNSSGSNDVSLPDQVTGAVMSTAANVDASNHLPLIAENEGLSIKVADGLSWSNGGNFAGDIDVSVGFFFKMDTVYLDQNNRALLVDADRLGVYVHEGKIYSRNGCVGTSCIANSSTTNSALKIESSQLLEVDRVYNVTVTGNQTLGRTRLYLDGVIQGEHVDVTKHVITFEATARVGSFNGVANNLMSSPDIAFFDHLYVVDAELTSSEVAEIASLGLDGLGSGSITGNIIESLDVKDWTVDAHRMSTGELRERILVDTDITTSFTFNAPRVPYSVTVLPTTLLQWKPLHAYVVDDLIFPEVPQLVPFYFKCIAAGTTDAVEPLAWDTSPSGTTVDATVTWQVVSGIAQPITHAPIIPVV